MYYNTELGYKNYRNAPVVFFFFNLSINYPFITRILSFLVLLVPTVGVVSNPIKSKANPFLYNYT